MSDGGCILCRAEREVAPDQLPMAMALLIDLDRDHHARRGVPCFEICPKHRISMARALVKVAELAGAPDYAVDFTRRMASAAEEKVLQEIDEATE